MIPLASDLLIRFRGRCERRPFKVAGTPNRLSSSGRFMIVGTISPKCPEVTVVPVDKIIGRCKQVTERASTGWRQSYCAGSDGLIQTATAVRPPRRPGFRSEFQDEQS
jgi:hypothetical protein